MTRKKVEKQDQSSQDSNVELAERFVTAFTAFSHTPSNDGAKELISVVQDMYGVDLSE